jgi:hypothetical protein
MRYLLAALVLPGLGCATTIITRVPQSTLPRMIVERTIDFSSGRRVPLRYQHMVDWHAGQEQVVILLSGGMACAVSSWEATKVIVGRTYGCQWRGVPPTLP